MSVVRGCAVLLVLAAFAAPVAAQDTRSVEHRIYFELQPDALVVQETLSVASAAGGAFQIKLPPRAELMNKTDNLEVEGRVLSSVGPVRDKDVFTFSYAVSGTMGKFTLDRELGFACDDLLVYGPDGAFTVEAQGGALQRGVTTYLDRPIDPQGRPYALLTGSKLQAGHRLELTFTPVAVRNPVGKMYAILAVLIVLGFCLLIAGLAVHQRAEGRRLVQTEAFVAAQIAELDKAHREGNVADEFHVRKTKELRGLVE